MTPEERASYNRQYNTANRLRIRKQQADYRLFNAADIKNNQKKYRTRNRSRIRKQVALYAARNRAAVNQKSKERGPDWHRKYAYGVTPTQFQAMLLAQQNACAICHIPFSETHPIGPCVDHCHKTQIVRGLLCRECNSGIGKLKDNPRLVLNALLYLTSSGADCNFFRLSLETDRAYSRWLAKIGN